MSWATNDKVKHAFVREYAQEVERVLDDVHQAARSDRAPDAHSPPERCAACRSACGLGLATIVAEIASLRAEQARLRYVRLAAQPHRHLGSAFSALPAHTRWSVKVQGDVKQQHWTLLRAPSMLEEHEKNLREQHIDFINTYRARRLTRREKRKLDKARRQEVS